MIWLVVTIWLHDGSSLNYQVREPNWTLAECQWTRFRLNSYLMIRPREAWENVTSFCVIEAPTKEFKKWLA